MQSLLEGYLCSLKARRKEMKLNKVMLMFLMIVLIIGTMPVVYAVPDMEGAVDEGAEYVSKKDNKEDPLTAKQLELRAKVLEARLNGKGNDKVVEVAKGQFVELEREGEKAIWTVLGEFQDIAHNEIAEPDREINNTTIWTEDYNRDYYRTLLFNEAEGANSMRNYYIEQSSGRFSVHGDVTNWVTVPYDAEIYDDDTGGVWDFLQDSIDGWYDKEESDGKTAEEINAYLSQFDVWDRYDFDGDGNFDEPDGYIDTFQSVHAGEGEEAGGGILGGQAIWSHSWYAHYELNGIDGPTDNLSGGVQIGDSDYWVGKYTIQPENGGVGVFAHEFGHDLGLPDLYDTSGESENSTGFWTLMSSGSWLNDGTEDIGSMPNHMGVWEKFQLGWLNYDVAFAGEKSVHRLGPSEYNTKKAQGLFVVLPQKEVTTVIGDPFAGEYFYYSGSGNDLDNFMYKEYTLAAGSSLSAQANVQIEVDWDYAYLVVSTDEGVTWDSVETNLSTSTDPNGQNFGFGITGDTGGWVELTADLSAYTGDVLMGFRYWTDVAAIEPGILLDDIVVSGYPLDGAEADAGWTFEGFRVSTGVESALYSHYYVCEYKTYLGYDKTLEVGPYNFGYTGEMENYVDHFAYQDGLLINYWDTSQVDNDTGLHPGKGMLLPIDAHYKALEFEDDYWRNRIQSYDSTFSKAPTDGIPVLHVDGFEYSIPSLPGVSTFDDRILHYDPVNPYGSVMHENTNTTITVVQEPYMRVRNNQAPFMQINVSPGK